MEEMSPLSKVYRCIVYTYSFAAKVEEISETDIDEWHESPDVNISSRSTWNMCFKLLHRTTTMKLKLPQKGG